MALKAYKHLTDGEVKIVEAGSAEETSLLGDAVQGASYNELTSTGKSHEVAAAQGTALWVDVTDELGGGGGLPTGMDYQVFEVTDLDIPSGTNWSDGGNPLGSFTDLKFHNIISAKLTIELAADPADPLWLVTDDSGAWSTNVSAVAVKMIPGGLGGATGFPLETSDRQGNRGWGFAFDIMPLLTGGYDPDPLPDPYTLYTYLRTPSGATTADITVVKARAAFLIL
jgi:hypothetical protein